MKKRRRHHHDGRPRRKLLLVSLAPIAILVLLPSPSSSAGPYREGWEQRGGGEVMRMVSLEEDEGEGEAIPGEGFGDDSRVRRVLNSYGDERKYSLVLRTLCRINVR